MGIHAGNCATRLTVGRIQIDKSMPHRQSAVIFYRTSAVEYRLCRANHLAVGPHSMEQFVWQVRPHFISQIQEGEKMRINFAHIRHPSTNAGTIDYAVFDAKANSNTTEAKQSVLFQLTQAARSAGHKIDQSAIAYSESGQIQFFGDKNLVNFLSKNGLPQWTHWIET
jgi:hypothetical protein